MQNLYNCVESKQALKPQAITTDTTTVGETIDLAESEANSVAVAFGAYTDGTYQVKFFESDDSGMSGEVEITATGRVTGDLYNSAVTPSTGDVLEYEIVKSLRYVRAKIVSASTTSGSLVSSVINLGRLRASLANERNA
jgi:hypothetical protein